MSFPFDTEGINVNSTRSRVITWSGRSGIVFSLVFLLTGIGGQIYENYERHSVEGIAPGLVFGAAGLYTSWCIYGWAKSDTYLRIVYTPGIFLSWILVLQYLLM